MSTKARVIAIVLLWAACSALLVQSGSAQPPPLPPIPVLPKIQLPPIPGLPLIPDPRLAQNPATSDSRPAQNPATPDSRPSFDSRFAADSRPSFNSRFASDSGAVFTSSTASYPWTAFASRSAPGAGSAATTPYPRQAFTSTTPNSRRSSCRTYSGHNQCWTAVANVAGCVPLALTSHLQVHTHLLRALLFASDSRLAQNPATSDSRPAQNPSTPDSRPSFDSRFAADSRPSFDSRLASDSGAAFTSYPWTAVTSRSAPGTGSASTTPCPRPVFTSTTPNSRRSSCRTSSGHNQCWTAVANAAGCVVDITPLLHRQLSTVGPACCKALIQ
uniref:Prolamin-like domain-containing protein n=1 Tax=Salix viminalis TaxID=40686 RepID=A0A6N2M4T8_SALVM